jgi:hypothetical protein
MNGFPGAACVETFELLLKFGKASYRRKTVSSLFNAFWTPASAGVTLGGIFQSGLALGFPCGRRSGGGTGKETGKG